MADPPTQRRRAVRRSPLQGVDMEVPGMVPEGTAGHHVNAEALPTRGLRAAAVPLFADTVTSALDGRRAASRPVATVAKGRRGKRAQLAEDARPSEITVVEEAPLAPLPVGIIAIPDALGGTAGGGALGADVWSSAATDKVASLKRWRTPLSTSRWNIHTRMMALSIVPALCFLGLFVFLISTSASRIVSDDTFKNEFPTRTAALVAALEQEVMAAADLLGLEHSLLDEYAADVAYRNVTMGVQASGTYAYSAFTYPESARGLLASRRVAFLNGVASSKAAVGSLMAYYREHSSALNPDGFSMIRDGIAFTSLDRARDAVLGGGESDAVLNLYASTLAQLTQFIGAVQLRVAIIDVGDMVEISRLFSAIQWSHSRALDTIFRIKRRQGVAYTKACSSAAACRLPYLAPIDDYGEYAFLWQVEGAVSAYEQFLRYAGAGTFHMDPSLIRQVTPATIGVFASGAGSSGTQIPYLSSGGTQGLRLPASMTLADGLLPATIVRDSILPRDPAEWLLPNRTGTVYGFQFSEVHRVGQRFAHWLSFSRLRLAEDLHSRGYIRLRLGVVLQYLFVAVAIAALFVGFVSALHSLNTRQANARVNAEVRSYANSLARMRRFLRALTSFDLERVAAFISKHNRGRHVSDVFDVDAHDLSEGDDDRVTILGTPWLEVALYRSFGQLRDLTAHLPPTAHCPPLALGLSPRHALCPALVYQRSVVAMRLDLCDFHAQFTSAPSRQKSSHHGMQHVLSLIYLIVGVGSHSELALPPSSSQGGGGDARPLVVVHPSHVVVWLNLGGGMGYPLLRALLMAKLLLSEARDRFTDKHVGVAIGCGDALVGHIGNALPPEDRAHFAPSSALRVVPHTTFLSFGPLAEALSLLATTSVSSRFSRSRAAASQRPATVAQGRGVEGLRSSATEASTSTGPNLTGSQLSGSQVGGVPGGRNASSPPILLNAKAVAVYGEEERRMRVDERYANAKWLPKPPPTAQLGAPQSLPMMNRVRRDPIGDMVKGARMRASLMYQGFLRHNRRSVLVEGSCLVLPKVLQGAVRDDIPEDDENALIRGAIMRAIGPQPAAGVPCAFAAFCREALAPQRGGAASGGGGLDLARGHRIHSLQHIFQLLCELFASNQGAGTNTNNRRLMVSTGQGDFDGFLFARGDATSPAGRVGSFLWSCLAVKEPLGGGRSVRGNAGNGGGRTVFFAPDVGTEKSGRRRALGAISAAGYLGPMVGTKASATADQLVSCDEFEMLLSEMSLCFAPLGVLGDVGGSAGPAAAGRAHQGGSPACHSVYMEVTLSPDEELHALRDSVRAVVVGASGDGDGGRDAPPQPNPGATRDPADGPPAGQLEEPSVLLHWPMFVGRIGQDVVTVCEAKQASFTFLAEQITQLFAVGGWGTSHARATAFTLEWCKRIVGAQDGVLLPSDVLGEGAGACGVGTMPAASLLSGMLRWGSQQPMCLRTCPHDDFIARLFDPCGFVAREMATGGAVGTPPCRAVHVPSTLWALDFMLAQVVDSLPRGTLQRSDDAVFQHEPDEGVDSYLW